MDIHGIKRVAIIVRDLEASERHWCENFGMTVVDRPETEPMGVRQVQLGFPNGTVLELFSPTDDTSPMAAVLAEHGEGVQVVGLAVDDVTASLAELQRKGVQTYEVGGAIFVHPKSANGVVVGLVDRDGNSPPS